MVRLTVRSELSGHQGRDERLSRTLVLINRASKHNSFNQDFIVPGHAAAKRHDHRTSSQVHIDNSLS